MANNSNLPEGSLQFIHRFITTVTQMEVLLLFAAKHEREWSVEEVNDELRSGHALMAEVLDDLSQAGLLAARGSAPDVRYRYSPDDALRRQVDALATLYRERRHSVLSAIYDRPAQSTDPIRAFADAFRFRSKPRGES
jgi:DNA-binding MarR family transcriptional regulator